MEFMNKYYLYESILMGLYKSSSPFMYNIYIYFRINLQTVKWSFLMGTKPT